jgi:hypothetical protein
VSFSRGFTVHTHHSLHGIWFNVCCKLAYCILYNTLFFFFFHLQAAPSPLFSVSVLTGVGTPDNICEDQEALQDAVCTHAFVGIVQIKSAKNTSKDTRGRFCVEDSKKSSLMGQRRTFYYQIPFHLYNTVVPQRIDMKIGQSHILISNVNQNKKSVRLDSTSVLLACSNPRRVYDQLDVNSCS